MATKLVQVKIPGKQTPYFTNTDFLAQEERKRVSDATKMLKNQSTKKNYSVLNCLMSGTFYGLRKHTKLLQCWLAFSVAASVYLGHAQSQALANLKEIKMKAVSTAVRLPVWDKLQNVPQLTICRKANGQLSDHFLKQLTLDELKKLIPKPNVITGTELQFPVWL